MNNIFNTRVKRLITDDLLEYGKHLLWFLGFVIGILMILNIFVGINVVMIRNIRDFLDINVGVTLIGTGIFSFVSSGFLVFMFISGIVTGYELPQHVRQGIARGEYFIGVTIAAIIVSLLIAPLILLVNMIFNLFVTIEGVFYHLFQMGGGEISLLIAQFLMYIALFLLGFCIAIIWQRVGWQLGVAFIVLLLMISSFLGWNIVNGFNVFNVTFDNYLFEIEWAFSTGFFIGVIMIAILGIIAYMLIKKVPVKVH